MAPRRIQNKKTPVEALHIEIDRVQQMITKSHIEHLYSSKAMVFPLDFKMSLVRDIRLLRGQGKGSMSQVEPSQILDTDGDMLHLGYFHIRSPRVAYPSQLLTVNHEYLGSGTTKLQALSHCKQKVYMGWIHF